MFSFAEMNRNLPLLENIKNGNKDQEEREGVCPPLPFLFDEAFVSRYK
jgi:hypothetical protein